MTTRACPTAWPIGRAAWVSGGHSRAGTRRHRPAAMLIRALPALIPKLIVAAVGCVVHLWSRPLALERFGRLGGWPHTASGAVCAGSNPAGGAKIEQNFRTPEHRPTSL